MPAPEDLKDSSGLAVTSSSQTEPSTGTDSQIEESPLFKEDAGSQSLENELKDLEKKTSAGGHGMAYAAIFSIIAIVVLLLLWKLLPRIKKLWDSRKKKKDGETS